MFHHVAMVFYWSFYDRQWDHLPCLELNVRASKIDKSKFPILGPQTNDHKRQEHPLPPTDNQVQVQVQR